MDQTTAWLVAFVILIVAFGVYLRRRYGNLYARFSDAVERVTGFPMVAIVRAIGILTLAAWAVVYLLSGRLDIWIGDQGFTVEAGDSFRIRGADYRWANPYDDPACAIWVISPPVY